TEPRTNTLESELTDQDLPVSDAAELLRQTKVEVAPATFFLVGMRHEDWRRLLENPELSPRPDAPFMLLRDEHEVTLLLEETDWRTMRHAVRDARVEGGFRLLTLDIVLEWNVVGYLARVSDILARAGISVGALSAFSRDHLLIKQDDLPQALRALGEHVAELC
ncbi:MAG: ACT domain-containing protein, partial [Pyrinomonadaceae bacterium]|nr:ACT domain-containing protein [Pyrinomonadaceae bacterium]